MKPCPAGLTGRAAAASTGGTERPCRPPVTSGAAARQPLFVISREEQPCGAKKMVRLQGSQVSFTFTLQRSFTYMPEKLVMTHAGLLEPGHY